MNTNKNQHNLVVFFDENDLTTLLSINQLVKEGWQIQHIGINNEAILKQFKMILTRIFDYN